jgi:hypothetical protein
MWCRVDLVWTDVSEERIASKFRVEKSASEEPAWAGGCRLERIASIFRVEKSASEEPAWAGGCSLHSWRSNKRDTEIAVWIQDVIRSVQNKWQIEVMCSHTSVSYDISAIQRTIIQSEQMGWSVRAGGRGRVLKTKNGLCKISSSSPLEGHAVTWLVEALYYKPKIAGSIPYEVIGFFNWLNPSNRTMVLGSTQPITAMSTSNLPGGKGRPVRKADKFTTICDPIV